ncbi:MAG: chromosome partitioning ATPase [Lautropia sp.]|nr:chromosome partitioning ATPase [Lautropia sp.]
MNTRLIQRAMQKLADQQPSKGTLPLTLPTLPTDQTLTSTAPSAECDELQAAHIRAEIAKADALRQRRASAQQTNSRPAASSAPSASTAVAPVIDKQHAPGTPTARQTAPKAHTQPWDTGTANATTPLMTPHPADVVTVVAEPPVPVLTETSNSGNRPHTTRPEVELDFPRLKERGFLVPNDKTAKIHQEFRLIKRRLLDNAFGRLRPVVKNGRLIMLTSSLPSEGKTFCSINLAISIAIGGEYPVLLVDADIARPSMSNTLELDLPEERGVADYLEDPSIPLSDLLVNTSLPGLTLLPAGQLEQRPVDLLASANMARLVEHLAHELPRHVIIFDSPPLLPVTETRSLSALVGQVMLVVAAGETPRSAVNEALLQLENCEAVGMLLNKAPAQPKAPAYYGY